MRDFLYNLLHLKMLRDIKYNISARSGDKFDDRMS
jgi:hypothetical protein